MRRVIIFIGLIALALGVVPAHSASDADQPAQRSKAGTVIDPGLLEGLWEPLFEDDTFSLETLIALHPGSRLRTTRGRCLSFNVFGETLTKRCERRIAETFTSGDTVIHWFGLGSEAIGLGTVPPLDPPQDGVLRYFIGTVYRVKDGKVGSEFAMGTCRMDAFYLRCHTIGKSGRIDVDFATPGGPATTQYPVDDAFFRYKNAAVFTAHGQCIRAYRPDGDSTPYCASFIGRTVDDPALITFFTLDGGLVFGFYGPKALVKDRADGSVITPITTLIRMKDDYAGTAPVTGQCVDSAPVNGHRTIDCQVTTVWDNNKFEMSFETADPWRRAMPLAWQQVGDEDKAKCGSCPQTLPKADPPL